MCHALTRSPRRLSPCPRRHELVCNAFCWFRALCLRMFLVTAYMFQPFSTSPEPDYDDEGVWNADQDRPSDLDMHTRFSEGEGDGWSDLDEACGRQLSQPLFFHAHSHRTIAVAACVHTPRSLRCMPQSALRATSCARIAAAGLLVGRAERTGRTCTSSSLGMPTTCSLSWTRRGAMRRSRRRRPRPSTPMGPVCNLVEQPHRLHIQV